MTSTYRIETIQQTHHCITVEADSPQEALERAKAGEGDAGDPRPGETIVAAIERLEC